MTDAGGADPELSVIIPMRNEAARVGAQLEALSRQDPGVPWEIVVVDHGSTDASVAVVEGWRDRLPAITIVDGHTAATISEVRNAGARVAGGRLLAFVDADDIVGPEWARSIMEGLQRADLATGPIDLTRLNPAGSLTWAVDRAGDLPAGAGSRAFTSGSNTGIRRAAFEALGGYAVDLRHGEDVDLSWRALDAGYEIASAPGALVHRRLRAGAWALFRQHAGHGASSAELHRRHGVPQTGRLETLREVAFLVLRSYRLGDPGFRRFWIVVAGRLAGRAAAAIGRRTAGLRRPRGRGAAPDGPVGGDPRGPTQPATGSRDPDR